MTPTRRPAVAGRFYPADPQELEAVVRGYLAQAAGPVASAPRKAVKALIAPHAGYVYSGAVAGAGFQHLSGLSVERVLLVGPSHYEPFHGGAVPAAGRYVTPLGEIPIDVEAVRRLERRPGVTVSDRPFEREHSLEMELPFLQETLRAGWCLLPVLVGPSSAPSSLQQLAEALGESVTAQTLVVVSSDFTHYGPRFAYVPFRDDLPRRLRELDMGAVNRILAGDRAGFETYIAETGATICGSKAIDVLLRLLPEGSVGSLAAYATSGSLTDAWDHSVSYASLVFRAPRARAGSA